VADRFYCADPPEGGRLTLDGDEARHLARVRRVGRSERVEVFDGRGGAVAAEVEHIAHDRVELMVVGPPLPDRVTPCHVTLATAVPKGERFDWLVEKATELGVARLVPLVTERSVVDLREAKLDRLRRLIIEACKQCGRNRLMELDTTARWDNLVHAHNGSTRLLAHPAGLPASNWPRPRPGGAVLLAVGPEGGFTDTEVESARSAGWAVVGLGSTRLRIETACLVLSSVVLALCEGRVE
jgi:16S rRNA (uracil1498-N3)-methyltransferase